MKIKLFDEIKQKEFVQISLISPLYYDEFESCLRFLLLPKGL